MRALSLFGISRLRADDDVRQLYQSSPETVRQQEKIEKLLGLPAAGQFFLVTAPDEQGLLEREESLADELRTLTENKSISGFQAVTQYVPSLKRQEADAALQWKRIYRPGALASKLFARLESPEVAATARAQSAAKIKPLTPEAWLDSPLSTPFRPLWLHRDGTGWASVVTLTGVDGPVAAELLSALGRRHEGVEFVDHLASLAALLKRFRAVITKLMVGGYAAVSALLLLRYRGEAWRVLLPTLLACLFTGGLFGALGLNCNLFFVFGILLSLDMGVDYGIYMQEKGPRGLSRVAAEHVVGRDDGSSVFRFAGLEPDSGTESLRSDGAVGDQRFLAARALLFQRRDFMTGFDADVLIIGAGPAGSMAAVLLVRKGHNVLVLEKERFPRFSIGESLLPQSIGLLEEAGMLRAVVEAGFQYKNGAAFAKGGLRTEFDFREKFGAGWGNAYQVERAVFDKVLADEAAKAGAEIRYGHEITAIDVAGGAPRLSVKGPDGKTYEARRPLSLGRQRLRPYPSAQARAGDAFEVSFAPGYLHARRGPDRARLRPQQDPRHRSFPAHGRLVLADPVLERPLLARDRGGSAVPRAL